MVIIITILVLGLIIFLHELGHFYTAKKFGMPVSEFSIGMGPLIYQKTYDGTAYSVRAIPIGGYVSIEGMIEVSKEDAGFEEFSDEDIEKYNREGFSGHSKIEKLIVLLAGVIMNFVTALIAYTIVAIISKGFSLDAIISGFNAFKGVFVSTFVSLKMILTGAVKANQLVGPVGLPKVFGQLIQTQGYAVLVPLFGLLSVNIGILNLLPIPALDGGRIVFVLLEAIGIKVSKKVEERFHTVGTILLLLLMVYVLFNDVLRIIR